MNNDFDERVRSTFQAYCEGKPVYQSHLSRKIERAFEELAVPENFEGSAETESGAALSLKILALEKSEECEDLEFIYAASWQSGWHMIPYSYIPILTDECFSLKTAVVLRVFARNFSWAGVLHRHLSGKCIIYTFR